METARGVPMSPRRGEACVIRDVHVNPNAEHRDLWLSDLDG